MSNFISIFHFWHSRKPKPNSNLATSESMKRNLVFAPNRDTNQQRSPQDDEAEYASSLRKRKQVPGQVTTIIGITVRRVVEDDQTDVPFDGMTEEVTFTIPHHPKEGIVDMKWTTQSNQDRVMELVQLGNRIDFNFDHFQKELTAQIDINRELASLQEQFEKIGRFLLDEEIKAATNTTVNIPKPVLVKKEPINDEETGLDFEIPRKPRKNGNPNAAPKTERLKKMAEIFEGDDDALHSNDGQEDNIRPRMENIFGIDATLTDKTPSIDEESKGTITFGSTMDPKPSSTSEQLVNNPNVTSIDMGVLQPSKPKTGKAPSSKNSQKKTT